MAADLTFDIAAIDKAAQTLIRMAQRIEKISDRLDQLDRKVARPEIKIDVDQPIRGLHRVETAFAGTIRRVSRNLSGGIGGIIASFSKIPGALTAVLVGSVAVLVRAASLVGAVVGSALIGGLGAAIATIPIIFAAQNKQVKQLWSALITFMKEEITELSQPFVPVLANIAAMIAEAFQDVAPTLGRVFETLAPVVERFAGNMIDALKELEPALEPIADAFAALLDELGPRLPGIVEHIADAISDLARTVEENPELFANFIEDLAIIAEVIIRTLDGLTKLEAKIQDFGGLGAAAGLTGLVEGFFNVEASIKSATDAGRVFGESNFVATLSAVIFPFLRSDRRAREIGRAFGRAVFTANLDGTTRRLGRAVGRAFGMGRRWGRSVWTATLNAVNNVWRALQSAQAAASRWAGRVFSAVFTATVNLPNLPFIPGAQHGGRVRRGQPVIVGEKRPELFVPHADGMILPRVPSPSGMLSSGRSVIELHITAGDSDLEQALFKMIRRGVRTRGGNVQIVLGR